VTRLTSLLLFLMAGVLPAAVFESSGVPIQVDEYRATAPGPHPAIIYLYGADAMAIGPEMYVALGNTFASRGYDFYIIHYLNRTRTLFADFTQFGNYSLWLQTVQDATTWVSNQPGVDPQRIAVMGISLGAGLSISEAAQDPRIKAVAEWCGAQWYERLTNTLITHLPATLILHGARDWLVSVWLAYDLQSVLQRLGTPYGIHIYPEAGHGFIGSDFADATQRTVAWFDEHLAQ
jgi:dipeptidyl aminopeptidase/acylaminoacyl peptidase